MNNQAMENNIRAHNTDKSKWGLNILVAEDNLKIQEIIKWVFENTNCALFMAVNGKRVLEELGSSRYDLILMDLHMPEMNGFETMMHIRTMERETGEHIPILAMTGLPLENGRKKCINAGMDDYLVKPFTIKELFEAVERLTHTKIRFIDPRGY